MRLNKKTRVNLGSRAVRRASIPPRERIYSTEPISTHTPSSLPLFLADLVVVTMVAAPSSFYQLVPVPFSPWLLSLGAVRNVPRAPPELRPSVAEPQL